MKFGITLGNFGTYGKLGGAADQVRLAEYAELLGYDSVWLHDHLVMPTRIRSRYPYNASGRAGFAYRQDIYDPLAMMAAVAVRTRRVQIATSVLIVPYRNPVVFAKMLATVDQLSRGRVVLGAGVGWMAEEFEALQIGDYYPVRGTVTDEWLRICIALWTATGPVSFQGRFHQFRDVGALPRPVQRPHIPIWIGGKTDVAARRVARLGSGYHGVNSTPEELAAELRIVHAELEKRGRDPSEVEVSMLGPGVVIGGAPAPGRTMVGGNKQQIIDLLAAYREVGLHHAVSTPRFADQPGPLTPEHTRHAMQYMAEEILPALR